VVVPKPPIFTKKAQPTTIMRWLNIPVLLVLIVNISGKPVKHQTGGGTTAKINTRDIAESRLLKAPDTGRRIFYD